MSDIEELADRLSDLKYDYDSMSTSLEDAIDDIADDVETLQDENERLRSCLSDSAENSKQIMHEAHVQADENAKLRELVRDMWMMRTPQIDFETYTAFRDRMRELGVEVDE